MDLIIHQFMTDWRHFRLSLVGLWTLFAAQLILADSFIDANTADGLQELLLLLQILAGGSVIAQIIHADALVGAWDRLTGAAQAS